MKDFHTILDLNYNATDDQIRSQYRQLVRIYHPDRFSNSVDKEYAERKLQEINEAYYGLLAPERTGKGVNRRLTQSQEKYPLLSATPGSVMILLSVLFVGVFLGGIDYDTLLADDPALADKTIVERLIDSWRLDAGAAGSDEPTHEWLSFSVYENYRNILYVVGADGQPQLDIPLQGHSPAWSPNREQLAFLTPGRDGTQLYTTAIGAAFDSDGRRRADAAEGDGELVRITQDTDSKENIVWSPNGEMIAYIAQGRDSETPVLKVATLSTGEISILTSARMGDLRHVAWLDDANLLVEMGEDDSLRLLQLPLDGQAAEPFVNFSGRNPAVAPSGQRVAVASDEGIFTLLQNGSDLAQLTAAPAWSPAWSPTGTKIAYLAAPVDSGDSQERNRSALWVMESDGQNPEQLTEPGTLTFSWSVDGTQLAFVTGSLQTQPSTLYLWTASLDGEHKLVAEISEPHVSWGRGP